MVAFLEAPLLVAVNRVEWTLSESNIDLVIIGLGANDMLRGIQPKETKNNLEKIIKTAQRQKYKSNFGRNDCTNFLRS